MPWIEQQSYIKAAFPFGTPVFCDCDAQALTEGDSGVMHDMQGVISADQLMASSGEPTDLGYYIINGQY